MRGDIIVQSQLMIAQAIGALAQHLDDSTGYYLTPVTFAELPANPVGGMIACVSDGVIGPGGVISGGGTQTLLIFYDPDVPDWMYAAGDRGGITSLKPITFAQLPTTPVQGMLSCINDSNRNGYGQTITGGGGTYIVLAFFDGTDWVVH